MIKIYENIEMLSAAAAELFTTLADEAVQDHGSFTVALSGGKTPESAYRLLAQKPYLSRIPWQQIHIFWSDERCVLPDSPDSSERMARHAFLDSVPIPPQDIHPIRCQDSPAEAAINYETLLKQFFTGKPPAFDLILLGLGTDGHTASLFPNTDVLNEKKRWTAETYVPGQAFHRVTFTAPLINSAKTIVFLVSGIEKSDILQRVFEGPYDPWNLPAQLIRPITGSLIWLIDSDAASKLSDNYKSQFIPI